jgi:peptidoglycan/xylan/chitin deacetylase (PgdA/CDA1 family)
MRHARIGLSALLGVALAALGAPTTPAVAGNPVHDYAGVVPVLVYHGIHPVDNSRRDPYSIAPAEFARQMGMLRADGFNTISIAQYGQFRSGALAGLPKRPILITFDDGRIDSFQAADPILARYGMRATMFVITAKADAASPGYLGWPALARMAAVGRWSLQEHAHDGHVLIATGPGGATGPYYANLLYRNGVRERFTAFKRRVTSDILTGRDRMASHIPGFEPLAFAVPYGSYGQGRTNYAPIPAWESGWLQSAFQVIFIQDRPAYNLPGNPIGQRYGIHAGTTAATLEAWLAKQLPRSAWTFPAVKPGPVSKPAPSHRPRRPALRRLRVGRHTVVMLLKAPARSRLEATRRRAGRRHRAAIAVSVAGRLRDRRLRAGTTYIYRVVAVGQTGRRSRVLRLRVHTRR